MYKQMLEKPFWVKKGCYPKIPSHIYCSVQSKEGQKYDRWNVPLCVHLFNLKKKKSEDSTLLQNVLTYQMFSK